MAYLDYLGELSLNQAITGAVASQTNLDFDLVAPNKGFAERVRLRVVVKEGFTFGTATYLEFQIRDSADDATYTAIATSKQFAAADLIKGKEIEIDLPNEHRQYLQAYYNPDGTVTAGTVDAHLIAD